MTEIESTTKIAIATQSATAATAMDTWLATVLKRGTLRKHATFARSLATSPENALKRVKTDATMTAVSSATRRDTSPGTARKRNDQISIK